MFKPFLLLLGVAASLLLLLGACGTTEKWVMLPNLSPPVATVVGKAMVRAGKIAKTVPNSFVLVSHGTAKFAIYPPGTVLIIQTIAWDQLKPGMTAAEKGSGRWFATFRGARGKRERNWESPCGACELAME